MSGSAPQPLPLEPTREEAQETLREELADPEYQRELSGPVREAFDAVVSWISERAVTIGGAEIPFGPILLMVLLAVAILLCVLLVRPRLQRAGGTGDELLDAETGISAEDLRFRAGAHAGAGKLDEAFRDLFRSIVRSAEERAILSEQAGRTASEAASAVAGVFPEHAQQIRRCGELFNLSHYGGRSLSSEDYERLRAVEETLRDSEPSSSGAQGSAPQLVVPR